MCCPAFPRGRDGRDGVPGTTAPGGRKERDVAELAVLVGPRDEHFDAGVDVFSAAVGESRRRRRHPERR